MKKTDEQPDEKTDEQPDTTVIPDLESEESAAQRRNQQGQVYALTRTSQKLTRSSQMLKRLPISLAQLKARNNSEKLKNEIIPLLYPLYQ